MRWRMPKIEDKRRSEVDPCIITLDEGESAENVAISIVKAAIDMVVVPGAGAKAAAFHSSSGDDVFSPEDAKNIRAQLQQHGRISLKYWKGRMVQLKLMIVKPNKLHIDLNFWADKLPMELFVSENIPSEAIYGLTRVLEVASAKV